MTPLREQQIGLSRCREIRHTVAGVEHDRPLFRWQLCVRSDGEGLVVAEPAAITYQSRPELSINLKSAANTYDSS